MRKSVLVTTAITFFALCYIAIDKGIDLPIAIALVISAISNVLNIVCEVKEMKERK